MHFGQGHGDTVGYMPINRLVVLLSPVYVGVAGWLVSWVAAHFPGHPHLNAADVRDLFIAGSLFAAAHVGQWLKGWQSHEKLKALPQAIPVTRGRGRHVSDLTGAE